MPNLSRRHLVTTAAALPALVLASDVIASQLSPSSDPIFAAIEKHRTAFAAFIAHSEYEDDLEEKGHELTPAPGDNRTSEMVAVVTASRTARAELAETVPTTMAGMSAYFDYLLAESEKAEEPLFVEEDDTMDFIRSLARAAKLIAREAVRS